MRIRRRYVAVLAAGAALAVAGIAYANHQSNVSSLTGTKICTSGTSCTSVTLPFTTFKPITLRVHTHTNYAHPGDKARGGFAKTVTLLFDDDGKLNLTGIPKCTNAQVADKNIRDAWKACGPGGSNNAYLSSGLSPAQVSGKSSTAPLFNATGQPVGNFGGCTLVFNGPTVNGKPTNVLYTRVLTVPNSVPNCSNPASNTFGNETVILNGTVTYLPTTGDFGYKLTVPGIDQLPLPLDDFTATVRRGSVFTARCHDAPNAAGQRLLNTRGTFQYSGTGQATDTVNSSQACKVG